MRRFIALFASLALFAVACGETSSTPKPTVVASIFPLFEAARFIGGSELQISDLSPLDPFGPLTEKQKSQLRDAQLAVVLGKGTQPEVEAIAAQRRGPTLRVLDLIDTQQLIEQDSTDPYVWLDPDNMVTIVGAIRGAMTKIDPDSKAHFVKHEAQTLRSLDLLDRRLAATISTCDRKELLTSRPDYQYFTDRYGLRQIPIDDTATLEAAVKQHQPSTVFLHELPSLDEAKKFKDRYGVRVSTLDPIAVQTDQARRGGSSYWSMMDLDLAAIRTGLGCKKVTVKTIERDLQNPP